MKKHIFFKTTIVLTFLVNLGCQTQANMNNNNNNNNPLLCDPESGVCALPLDSTHINTADTNLNQEKTIKIVYFTDPICSSCWGIEPQLRKLKLQYGADIEIDYRMGGLLPDWSYNSGGISKPSDVAHHWDEVSAYYDMPIDGDVWLTDPLASSYPPSIAFKAAQMQDEKKAVAFLREIREMVFLEKKNITKWEHLSTAAKHVGLDLNQFKTDYEGKAKSNFEEDLKLARQMGVRGFPTLFFAKKDGPSQTLYGFQPYSAFERILLQLHPTIKKHNYGTTWNDLFQKYTTLTAREFSELSGIERKKSEALLNELVSSGKLEKLTTKNGSLWKLK